jgi:hypothetical protein
LNHTSGISGILVGHGVRKNELLEGDNKGDDGGSDDGWVSKNLPRIFFGPLVGVKLLLVWETTGAVRPRS